MHKCLIALITLAVAACGSAPTREGKDGAATRAARTAATHPDCPTETGSHIRRPPGEPARCLGPGTNVSRDELIRTGSPNLPDALRRTVPSIR